ncbi:hypothetical protein [Legionella shakespearei]|uniref:Coiled-coil protein n=1 Tax=Legionella shakespearei DSM 23087 TaxID=1122169 RepID=A0A0W0YZW7_9GAMM|nr:hypothetical protein [Legionella shakespearei]KTD62426.1 coiled-coil protein [Legionella shakespearei DSM 23087]
MEYASQTAAFRRDKHQFFAQISSVKSKEDKVKMADDRAATTGYSFLLENQKNIETEFTELFDILQKQDDENKEAFWLYCYYCASLLEAYHRAYSQSANDFQAAKEKEYAKSKLRIKDRLNGIKKQNDPDEPFIDSLYHSFIGGFNNLFTSPLHISKVRDYVAYANLCRIYATFCRLTLTTGFTLAKELEIIDKLEALLGTHIDVDKIVSVLQAPVGVFNYLSVGFFLARFVIDAGLLIKHTFFPTELEQGAVNGCDLSKLDYLPGAASIEAYRNSYILIQNEESNELELYYVPRNGTIERLNIEKYNAFKTNLLKRMNKVQSVRLSAQEVNDYITAYTQHVPEVTTAYDRFKQEFYKRHCNFANDLVWATVNGLCNFNYLFNISAPVAGYITSVFLTFDVCMTLYKCHLAEQEYLTKKAQYLQERNDYNNPDLFGKMTSEQRRLHIEMLDKQLVELEINWQTNQSTFYFVAAAAVLLAMGFTAATLVSPPLLVLASFFVCTVAVAMYLSTDAYSKYKEKELYLEHAQLTKKDLPVSLREYDVALKEYEYARNDFIFTMVKNTVMPIILITTFAICWPAALVLTAMYVGYEIYHAHSQHSDNLATKQLALCAPEDDARLLPCAC